MLGPGEYKYDYDSVHTDDFYTYVQDLLYSIDRFFDHFKAYWAKIKDDPRDYYIQRAIFDDKIQLRLNLEAYESLIAIALGAEELKKHFVAMALAEPDTPLPSMASYPAINKPCVYFLFKNSHVVYVGKSTNGVYGRINTHIKDKSKEFDTWGYVETTASKVDALEAEWISKIDPIFNKVQPKIAETDTVSP